MQRLLLAMLILVAMLIVKNFGNFSFVEFKASSSVLDE